LYDSLAGVGTLMFRFWLGERIATRIITKAKGKKYPLYRSYSQEQLAAI